MGEDAGSLSTGSRPNSSAVKSREAKKQAALWKKQVKSLKLKDVGKKVEAVRFCAQDERFFREQAEVLPLLMGFLSRTKTPELVLETLNVMCTLLSATETGESDSEGIHPEANASFILDRSVSVDSAWKAGEPFVNVFSLNALAPEVRIKAIEVYGFLLQASVAQSESAGEATPALLQFQSVGSPCSALLGCLSSDNGDLEFEALSCLRSLLRNPPSEEFLDQFEAEKGVSWSLKFLAHSERRFHRPALGILESFSHFECGRLHLKANEAASILRNAIQETHEMIQKTSTVVPVSGVDASPLSVKDALELCSNIGIICQVFVRATLAKELISTGAPSEDNLAVFTDAIDAMIGILRYDIATALAPPVIPSESPRTTSAATAAANTAAANAAALAALIPFSIDRSIAIISSIGRMSEYCEVFKAHAKAKGLLPILFDCFQVKEAHKLYQVADKLLHLCVHIHDVDQSECTRLDPQILCSVAGDLELNGVDDASANGEKPPLLAVDTVLALLETSLQAANNELLSRILRWVAVLVDLPGNANALGERCVSISLQVLSTVSNDKLLFAFLAKIIHTIILQSSSAFELCGSSGHEPSSSFLEFLLQKSETTEPTDPDSTQATEDEADQVSNNCKLEWIDEYEEEAAFEPKPLMEALHNVDVYFAVAEALAGLTKAFLKWNPIDLGTPTINFSELIAARLHGDASPGKQGASAASGSKKKLATDPAKSTAVGESVMLCILEKGLQVPKLISKYAAVNPAVCVSMLGLLDNLLSVPSGMSVLLHLAKLEAQSPDQSEPCQTVEAEEWPLSVEKSSQMEHTRLLVPVLNVLQCPDTSFIEIEASIRTLTAMTSDLEPSVQVPPAPEPVETAKSPTKSGVAVVPPPAVPSVPELEITESDRFINAAVGCGALVVLLAFLDLARIPREISEFSTRANKMKTQIEEMVQKFITLAQTKQVNIEITYWEKLAQLNIDDTESPEPGLSLPYKTRWAQLLLDRKVTVSRFGYVDYTALLLASELALPNLVTTLLSVGASSEIASPDGVTPLMLAFLVGNEEMVIDLLDVQANVDAITTDGQDLTVWNCALVSPVKARVSQLVSAAYTNSEGLQADARIQLDSIEGSLQFLDMCLDAGVDANVSNAQGDFLLHSLLSKSIVRRKLRGLDVCFRYNSYYEDRRRLQGAVADLIQGHSAGVNSCNRMGQTPLHLALLYGYTGIAKILLEHGANPNVQGIYGHLPLHYACLGFCGSLDGSDGEAIELTRLLLENASKFTCTLGVHSDRRKHKSSEEKQALAIESILENGRQSVIEPPSIVLKLATPQQILTTASFMGKFLPWHFACGAYVQLSSVLCLDDDMQKWFEANGQARADIIHYLIREWKIDANSPASEGVTALHLAVKSDNNGNNLPVIDLLLERTTNVNAVHDHILIDSLPVIPSGTQAVFLDGEDRKAAFVSSRSIDGKYHILLEDGQHLDEVARAQLQVLHDPEKKHSHHSHHYKYLVPMESRFSALHYALQSNQDTLALRLLAVPDLSLDPEGSDLPLLALACAARQTPEVVSRLINQQANMRVHLPLRTTKCDLTTVDTDTSSSLTHRKQAAALHYAVMYDDYSMVEVLLTNSGGHVHPDVRRSGDGYTPLHLACQTDNLSIIKLLLDHGASLTKLSSMSAHGVSPLQLLIKFDSVDNDNLKDLIREGYLRPEMLLEGIPTSQILLQEESKSTREDGNNEQEDSDAPTCALLREEEINLDLFDRLQGLNRDKRGNVEARTRRLEAELEKSNAVLCLFFDLFKQLRGINDPAQEDHSELSNLMGRFLQLQHRHECYRQFTTRSQWKPKNKVARVIFLENLRIELSPLEMKLLSGEERSEDASCSSLGEPSQLLDYNLGGHLQLPILPNTAREYKCDNNKPDIGGSQTARIRFAPPPRLKQNAKYGGRSVPVGPRAIICEPPTDLLEKQVNTANCFTTLETWQRTMEAGALKSLLVDVQEVLHDAIYGQVEPGEGEKCEYFSFVAGMQDKLKLQQQERKRLTTKLAMENAIEQDLTTQLQLLERELAQLHTRHAHNRSEIEGERKAVQILERDYALLTDQEQELLRDCEVLELQLDNQRAQLKEVRSQQLYLDFVSSAPLKRHMEEKKWQEQHASVALQVQNADAENRAIEDEIRKLEEEAASLEEQYTRDMLSKQQSETALSEIQASYEQFQEAFARTRVCYTPRPDWDRIVDETPELSVQKYQWEGVDSASSRGVSATDAGDKGGVLERLDSTSNVAVRGEERSQNKDRTKTLVKEMLHWIERLQKHCGVNLHLSRIWHDVEEARVELNILHHQLDRAVRKTSMIPIVLPNMLSVITITAATSPTPGSPSKRRQDYIMALGMHEAVPLFLRHRGKLKRRTLKKIDVEKVVRKVWVEKRKREQRNPLGRFPLDQVLYEKLHRKYGFQPLIAEWGYNLLLALQTFSWDSEIEMFLLCLTGAVSDLVYVDQEQMIQGCQRLLLRLCELYNVESFVTERRVLLKDALVALRTFFPLKTSAQLQAIEQSIIRDMHKMKRGGNDSILYVDDILPLDVKYPLGFFVKTIRTQHFKEIQDYYALLLSELEQRDSEQQGILPLAAVRDVRIRSKAITAIDPLADAIEVQSLVMKALRIKTRMHLHLREPVLYKAVLRKMNATCLMKFALNFDQNAEVNWRRRPGIVYIDTSTLGIATTKKD